MATTNVLNDDGKVPSDHVNGGDEELMEKNNTPDPPEPVADKDGPSAISHRRREIICISAAVATLCVTLGIVFGVRAAIERANNKLLKYPDCAPIHSTDSDDILKKLGDGKCDISGLGFKTYGVPWSLNSKECGYDHGDCDAWNQKYMNCGGDTHPSELEDLGARGFCKKRYNNEACGYDDGLCVGLNEKYSNCTAEECDWYCKEDALSIGNGQCYNRYNTEECGYDGGDCVEFNKKYPNCTLTFPSTIGDDHCDNYEPSNTEECGFDGGDCVEFNKKYPNCTVLHPYAIGDGLCDDYEPYNSEECGFDGGDCE